MKEMTQTERLDYLVEEFKEDSVRYRDLETPEELGELVKNRLKKCSPEEIKDICFVLTSKE